jgi:hypothetical protein
VVLDVIVQMVISFAPNRRRQLPPRWLLRIPRPVRLPLAADLLLLIPRVVCGVMLTV